MMYTPKVSTFTMKIQLHIQHLATDIIAMSMTIASCINQIVSRVYTMISMYSYLF